MCTMDGTRNRRAILALCAVLLVGVVPLSAEQKELVYAFRSYESIRPEKMILVGEIRSKTKAPEPYKTDTPFINYDTRLDSVTVKIMNREGIKVGQRLYVIEKDPFHSQYRHALVVGEITVRSILHNPFYGWVLTGYGNLLRVKKGNFVARTLETENLESAFQLKKRGDHYRERGEFEKAMASYNQALDSDGTLPEAHASLGEIYLHLNETENQADPVRAISEFTLAYKYRENFRYKDERYEFYVNYIKTLLIRYDLFKNSATPGMNLDNTLQTAMDLAIEAEDVVKGVGEHTILEMQALIRRMERNRATGVASADRQFDSDTKRFNTILLSYLKNPDSRVAFHEAVLSYYKILKKRYSGRSIIEIESIVDQLYNSRVYSLDRGTRMATASDDAASRLNEMIEYHRIRYLRYAPYGSKPVDPNLSEPSGNEQP